MGVPILRGRGFTSADTASTTPVAIVDDTLAARFWPGAEAIGRHVSGWGFHDLQIVGVAGHVKNYGAAVSSRQELYVPLATRPRTRMYAVVRTAGDPTALTPAVRRTIAEIDPGVAAANIHAMRQLVDDTIAGTRIASVVGAAFAGVAILLASVGLSGLIAYVVELRRREIGIRLALGARPSAVVRHFAAHAARLTLAGSVVGVVGGILAVMALRANVAGVEGLDLRTVVAAPAILGIVTAIATWLPARRAARVSPTVALQQE
jgi:ABC-type antimicrobial peptide transport system permease subunit